MKETIGSISIGQKPEEERDLTKVEFGDVVAVQRFSHVFGDPPKPEGAAQIARGSIPMKAPGKNVFTFIFIGNGTIDKPLSKEVIEKRMNALGWFRQTQG